jgi:hypothetical protein
VAETLMSPNWGSVVVAVPRPLKELFQLPVRWT